MSQSSLEVDIVGNTLNYGDGTIDFDDILCILPGPAPSQYRVLFFHNIEKDSDESEERTKLKKIDIKNLPTELSRFETTIPSHLQNTDKPPVIQVVISTGSGTGKARPIFQNALQPLLNYIGLAGIEIYETTSTQTITELAQTKFVKHAVNGVPQTIILLSGDGGLVDILDIFYKSRQPLKVAPNIVLIPCGTGNAMASSIGLRSGPIPGLSTLLRGTPSPIPVFGARFSPGSQFVIDEGRQRMPIVSDDAVADDTAYRTIHGAVVASWGLHAALVADSDTFEYRKFGIDRFKMAANELLYPSDGSPCHRFKGKVTMSLRMDGQEGDVRREVLDSDEHMYALAAMVPRFEKEFLISPESVPLSGDMKFVRFGPMSSEDALHLMTLAYQGGKHVEEETVTYADIDGLRIDFLEDKERWRRVCIDGKIVAVDRDGWMELYKEPERLLHLIQ
jgi:diacylglycerol kinase family enzyme